MQEVLLAFGRGFVKVVISLLIGAGAGLLALGIAGRDQPELWHGNSPAPELLLGMGVGLLTAGAVMAILFMFSHQRVSERDRTETGSDGGLQSAEGRS
jgi:hypothetical protein